MSWLDLSMAGAVLSWFLVVVKVALVLFVVGVFAIWRGSAFARKRAYGPGGGRR